MRIKKLDSFKNTIILKDILNLFKSKRIFVEITNWEDTNHIYEIIVDETEQNDVGFFFGRLCETTISSKSICKIIDKDEIKIIDNEEKYNIGMIIKFKSLEPVSLF